MWRMDEQKTQVFCELSNESRGLLTKACWVEIIKRFTKEPGMIEDTIALGVYM